MAEAQPVSAQDAIRGLTNESAIYQAFDSYPWHKDRDFHSGLYAILGTPGSQRGSLEDIITHARVFYYAQKINVNIDFSSYKVWLSRHPEHKTPDLLPQEYRTVAPSQPAWQQAAPKADLYIDRSAASENTGGEQPSYPMGFAEMIKLIQEGKEVPGIRQIPNTVAREPGVKPIGSMAVPRKPWEKPAPTSGPANETLDMEFPPIDNETSG